MLEQGQQAPNFTAVTTDGDTVSLDSNRGHYVVLYFYPKDDTPGCTREACAFRDTHADYRAANAVVYGVSADTRESHQRFAEKYSLNFPLLVDHDGEICDAYGVERGATGNPKRVTFLIDPEGTIARVWKSVDVNEHAAKVLSAIAEDKAA